MILNYLFLTYYRELKGWKEGVINDYAFNIFDPMLNEGYIYIYYYILFIIIIY